MTTCHSRGVPYVDERSRERKLEFVVDEERRKEG